MVRKKAAKPKQENTVAASKPKNPALWARAKAAAKKKYKVYPSAYANAYAAKWYKDKGGKWGGSDNRVRKS